VSRRSDRRAEAQRLRDDGRLQDAARVYRELLEDCDDRVPDVECGRDALALVQTLFALERHDEARRVMERASADNPSELRRAVSYWSARLDIRAGDAQAGIDSLRRLAGERSDDEPGGNALVTLASAALAAGQARAAAELLQTALHSPHAHIAEVAAVFVTENLAAVSQDAAVDALREATRAANREVATRASAYLGQLLARAGLLEQAIEPLTLATKGPNAARAAEAAVPLGQIYVRLGDPERAREALMAPAQAQIPGVSGMARRMLLATGLWGDGAGIPVCAEVNKLVQRMSGASQPLTRAALARDAAALIDETTDAPLAALLWAFGADVRDAAAAPLAREYVLAVKSGVRAVELAERTFDTGDPQIAAAHWMLAQARAAQLDADPHFDPDDAIAIQRRGVEAMTALPDDGVPRLAMAKHNLGMLHLARRPTPGLEDLETALDLFEQALEAYRAALGDEHQLFFSTLGSVLSVRASLFDKAAHDEREASILEGEQALAQGRKAGVPGRHMLPLVNALTRLYIEAERGDHVATVGRAIDLGEEAVRLTDERFGPKTVHAIHVRLNLSTAYRGDDGAPTRSIAALEEALRIADDLWGARAAPEVATLHDNLANAYGLAAVEADGPPDALNRALEHHVAAVTSARHWFGPVSAQLADALLNQAITLGQGGSSEDKRRAISLLHESLAIRRELKTDLFDVANLLGLIATTNAAIEPPDVDAAVAAASGALEIFTPTTAPRHVLGLGSVLGFRLGDAGRWSEASEHFALALESASALQDSAVLMRSHSREAWASASLAVNGAYAHAMSDRSEDAVLCIERSRALWLREGLARDHADLQALEEAAPDAARRLREAMQRLRALRRDELAADDAITARMRQPLALEPAGATASASLYRAAGAAQRQFAAVLNDVHRIPGVETLFAAPTLGEVCEAIPDGWVAAYLATAYWETIVLLLWPDGRIDRFAAPLRHPRLAAALGGDEMLADMAPKRYLLGQLGDRAALAEGLGVAERLLAADVLEPLAARLREADARGAILVPCGGLSALPLHALAYRADRRCLLDDLDIVFAPSLRVLRELRRSPRAVPGATTRFFGLANPTEDLPFAAFEVAGVAGRFIAPLVAGPEARAADVLAALQDCDIAHIACHGHYDAEELLDSSLILGGGDRLRLRDLLSRDAPMHMSLLVASACQTAVNARHPDEAMTLSAAFIYAGAAAAIGSLWRVNDLSTAVLMSRFYELLEVGGCGLAPWSALRHAQLWLRDAGDDEVGEYVDAIVASKDDRWTDSVVDRTGNASALSDVGVFNDPFHWAPFVCTGAP